MEPDWDEKLGEDPDDSLSLMAAARQIGGRVGVQNAAWLAG